MLRRICLPILALALIFALAGPSRALAQAAPRSGMKKAPQMVAMTVGALKWGPLSVPGFDPGAEIAVVVGDPGAASGAYTLRLRFPAGYRFPSHWHPNAENVTVLSGSFQLGMGTVEDRAAEKTYGPGDFLMIPGHHPHFGGASEATVVQLHGMAPFKIVLSKEMKKPTMSR